MYGIVHSEHPGAYRAEKRGLLGCSFVTDPSTRDYLGFRDLDAARTWVYLRTRATADGTRRWRVVSDRNT